jgi:hypothetical protein
MVLTTPRQCVLKLAPAQEVATAGKCRVGNPKCLIEMSSGRRAGRLQKWNPTVRYLAAYRTRLGIYDLFSGSISSVGQILD